MKLFKITICDYNAKQIEEFISKYDEQTYDDFNKSKDLLNRSDYIKANYTKNPTDIDYWIKNDQSNELPDILLSLKSAKVNKESDITKSGFHPRGKYRHLGIRGQWDVYQPLDALASMDLGVNTGWCTTGRYGHYGEGWNFKPSYDDARRHFNNYTSRSIEFYYLLNPSTHFGEYAVAVYPRTIKKDMVLHNVHIKAVNAEIYNAADHLDYSKFKEIQKCLPADLLKIDIVEFKNLGYGLFVDNEGICYSTNSEFKNKTTELTYDEIKCVAEYLLDGSTSLRIVNLPNCIEVHNHSFKGCTSLKTINLPNCEEVHNHSFEGCTSLKTINLPNCETVFNNAFEGCTSLNRVYLPQKVITEDLIAQYPDIEFIPTDK